MRPCPNPLAPFRPWHWLSALLLAMAAQPACSQQPASTGASLSGKLMLPGGPAPKLYLVRPDFYTQLINSFTGSVVDTAAVAPDGSFEFRRLSQIQEKGLYLLLLQPAGARYDREIVEGPAENYACLVLEPGVPIRLLADARNVSRSYQLTEANSDSRLLLQLRGIRAPILQDQEVAVIKTDEGELPEPPAVQKELNSALEAFLDTTTAPLPAFAALRLRAPGNDFRDQPEFFLHIRKRLSSLAPGHPWLKQLDALLDTAKLPLLLGEKMPGFALPTSQGDTLRLENLHSKLLLVDFWASWCAPCLLEIRQTIRPLYEQLQGHGFQVLGVSIDRDRTSWTNAIRREGASWPQVCDLLGDATPVRQSLRFEYIPANYLLDADGRLLARNLHGDALRTFVQSYLEQH